MVDAMVAEAEEAQKQEVRSDLDDEIDRVRMVVGLSRPQLKQILGDYFDRPEADVYARLASIEKVHQEFLDLVRRSVALEFQTPAEYVDGVPCISTVQAARALYTGEFHLTALRARGHLPARKTQGSRRAVYSQDDIERFLTEPMKPGSPHSGMALAFVRWYTLGEFSA